MTSSYHVSVGSFSGPFDLLLQLIARRRVDIYDIPISQITDDYLAVLRSLGQRLDLDVATDFLVVAATLVELKAARLLPGEDDPEPDELALEARDLLYARLLDYRSFKGAAGFLAARLDALGGYVPRAVRLEERYAKAVPRADLDTTPDALAALVTRVMAERAEPAVDLSHVQPVRMTVREAAGMLSDELVRAGGRATFRELTAGCRHRIEVIVCFLALLELFKLGHVELEQPASFGELSVSTLHEGWSGSVLEAVASDGALEPAAADADATDTAR